VDQECSEPPWTTLRQFRDEDRKKCKSKDCLKSIGNTKNYSKTKKAEMIAPRQTFDDAIDLMEGATPPWGPIYPMLAYHLEELNKYLHKMLAGGKIVHSKSPADELILFVHTPEGRP